MGLRSKGIDILGGEKPREQRCGWAGQLFLRTAGAQHVTARDLEGGIPGSRIRSL